MTPTKVEMLQHYAASEKYDFTWDMASFSLCEEGKKVSAATLWRWAKAAEWKQIRKRTRPMLSQANMSMRLRYSTEHVTNEWNTEDRGTVWLHLDEKWFYGYIPHGSRKEYLQVSLTKNFVTESSRRGFLQK